MFLSTLRDHTLALIGLMTLTAACGEPACPDGTYKVGHLCRRLPDAASESAIADEGGTSHDADRANGATEAGAATGLDAGGDASASGNAMVDASGGPTGGGSQDAGMGGGGSNDAGASGPTPPAPECDSSHPCSAGFVCNAMKCVSACA